MINRTAQTVVSCCRILTRTVQPVSTETELINSPPAKYADNREALKANTWRDLDVTGYVKVASLRNLKLRISVMLSSWSAKSPSWKLLRMLSDVWYECDNVGRNDAWSWPSSGLYSGQHEEPRRTSFLQVLWTSLCFGPGSPPLIVLPMNKITSKITSILQGEVLLPIPSDCLSQT